MAVQGYMDHYGKWYSLIEGSLKSKYGTLPPHYDYIVYRYFDEHHGPTWLKFAKIDCDHFDMPKNWHLT